MLMISNNIILSKLFPRRYYGFRKHFLVTLDLIEEFNPLLTTDIMMMRIRKEAIIIEIGNIETLLIFAHGNLRKA